MKKFKFNNKKTLVTYGVLLALTAFLLEWLEYNYVIKVLEVEVYSIIIALCFLVLGVWLGRHLTRPADDLAHEINTKVINRLGLTDRELQVLSLLSEGHSNKDMADQLFVAPNTIKTHVLNIYKKLDVERRTQAIHKARKLKIVR